MKGEGYVTIGTKPDQVSPGENPDEVISDVVAPVSWGAPTRIRGKRLPRLQPAMHPEKLSRWIFKSVLSFFDSWALAVMSLVAR